MERKERDAFLLRLVKVKVHSSPLKKILLTLFMDLFGLLL